MQINLLNKQHFLNLFQVNVQTVFVFSMRRLVSPQFSTTCCVYMFCDYLCHIFRIDLRHRRRCSLFSGGFFLHGGHHKQLQRRLSEKRRKTRNYMKVNAATRQHQQALDKNMKPLYTRLVLRKLAHCS